MVNITNVKEEIEIPAKEKIIESFFSKQKELLIKYKDIETFGGKPFSLFLDDGYKLKTINTLESQEICKNFAWRTTEEVAEALDAMKQNDRIHLGEEIADGLHFITELMLINGISSKEIKTDIVVLQYEEMRELFSNGVVVYSRYISDFVRTLGMSQNSLKCKPWKQSQTLVDEKKYRERLIEAYYMYFIFCFSLAYSLEDIYCLYFKKHAVNNFRIATKY